MASLEDICRQMAQMQMQAEMQALREQALLARVSAAEAALARFRADAPGGGDGGNIGDGAAAATPTIPAKLAFPKHHLGSPTGDKTMCFLEDAFVALVPEPATLPVDASLSRAFAGLMAVAGNARGMGQERNFYALATAKLPSFARTVGEPSGDMTANALFSPSAMVTSAWSFPPLSKPELHARGGGGDGGPLCPAFNGELKTAGDGRALEQAAMYTSMDLVRIFFPAAPAAPATATATATDAANDHRLFYLTPPLGFAVVAYPYLAQVMAVECVGKMLVSPFSQPFLLGSDQHAATMAALPQPHYEAATVLDLTEVQPWYTVPGARADLSMWCTHGGVFRKIVRGDARSGAGFASMHAAYARLAAVLPHAPSGLHLLTSVRLLYGLHCVLAELKPVVMAGRAVDEETELRQKGAALLLSVTRAVAWLATQRVIYTDVRAPNVVVDTDGVAWLVDYDDCVVVAEPVASVDAFKAAVGTCPGAQEAHTFAAHLCAGTEAAFEAALKQAFIELGVYKCLP